MRARLAAWSARIDELSLRERAILLVVSLLVLYLVCDRLFLSPTLQGIQRQRTDISELRTKLEALEARSLLLGQKTQGPLEIRRARIAELESELAAQNRQFEEHLGKLVRPQQAARLLQDILRQDPGLRLLNLDTAPGAPLLASDQRVANIVRYDLDLRVEGNYLAVLDYLKRLEQLPWSLFWSDFELAVGTYPRSEARLSVYTLGQQS